ncbi:MAG: family 10 glycosylhydrolase [Turicibacter sp.]|nr:family 10 glycosylhydrolase [Turicibacter sp.]
MGYYKIHTYQCDCPYCQSVRASKGSEPQNQDHVTAVNPDLTRDLVRQEVASTQLKALQNAFTQEPMMVGQEVIYVPKVLGPKKDELRGVWITTVRNNDFPSEEVYANGFNLELFKTEFLTIIRRCKALKLNAIFFQVRPEGDAFYESGVNPWSAYLTGEQGVKPNWGQFDPLKWMIEVTHQAGIEFHAWFNPFRLTPTGPKNSTKQSLMDSLSDTHYARRHLDWVYYFNRQIYLDPGVPAVREFIVQTVMEVVEKYEIDAVHFDDYFYPYSYVEEVDGKQTVISFADKSPDYQTYEANHEPNEDIDTWREQNINQLIYELSRAIHHYDVQTGKSVAFGISPFGVWASAEETNGVGSNTSSAQLSSLSEYVNSKLWIDEEWIDYIVPQNYWSLSDSLSPFAEVAHWWSQIVAPSRTQLYMGLGLYLYNEDFQHPAWQNPEEIVDQIRYLRTLDHNDGYVFFTYHNLLKNGTQQSGQAVLNQAVSRLESEALMTYSLVPPRQWLQMRYTSPVKHLIATPCDEGCTVLQFEDDLTNNSQYYVIYRVPRTSAREEIDFSNASYILDIVGKNKGEVVQYYTDTTADPHQVYTYAVTALSQAQVESTPISYVYVP